MPAIKTPVKYVDGRLFDAEGWPLAQLFQNTPRMDMPPPPNREKAGQAIADALNSSAENAELRERVEAYKAMLAGVRRIEFVDGTVLAQGFALQGTDLAYWFYEPDGKDFDSALDAYKALRGEEGK